MELLVAITSSGAAVMVALINNMFTTRQRKKDNIVGRMQAIETKLDTGNRGTMTGLKIQLQETYEKQRKKVENRKHSDWSPILDQVFREAYCAYKNLGGNGIIDRFKQDMDIWRDSHANDIYTPTNKK